MILYNLIPLLSYFVCCNSFGSNFTIGAIFEPKSYGRFDHTFYRAIRDYQPDSSVISINGIAIESKDNLHDNIQSICSLLNSDSVVIFIVFGSQQTICSISLVTDTLGIPLLSYTTDKQDHHRQVQGDFHIRLEHAMTHMARGVIKFFDANFWFEFLILIEDAYLYDGFYNEVKYQTKSGTWNIQIVTLSQAMSQRELKMNVNEKAGDTQKIVVLHMSVALVDRLFQSLQENLRTLTWFITKKGYTRDRTLLHHYPTGSLSILINEANDIDDLLTDSVALVSSAISSLHQNKRNLLVRKRDCFNPSAFGKSLGNILYSQVINTTNNGLSGHLGFDSDGSLKSSTFTIRNLVQEGHNKIWHDLGHITKDDVRPFGIMWPFEPIDSHLKNGKIRYRIVTNPVKPFIIEGAPHPDYNNSCAVDTVCLKIFTKDKLETLHVLQDYENKVYNMSHPYEIRCCRGLAIDLLNRLSSDLDFEYTLYIVYDKTYGKEINGSWNGMVKDLMIGTAHMAVAAFSITPSRLGAIDFTYPYYFSRFTILYSEQNRKTHILAFLEPFDPMVWFTILISGTVSAFGMALFEWNSPFGLNPWGRKRKQNYTIASGLTMVYSVLFGHTVRTKSPKSWPSKVMQNFWAFACIFIIASYTANLAAFIAGKHTGIKYNDIFDSRLLDIRMGVLGGSAVEALLRNVNSRLYRSSQKFLVPTSDDAIQMLVARNIDAYLGDYPILDYARVKLDPKCELRILTQSFGEDGYGIGLPKGSPLKTPLSEKIKEYHRKGYIEDLIDIHFDEEQCFQQRITQEGLGLEVSHHAGLFALLCVGILFGIMLMLVEHAVFKWLVPYCRKMPQNSKWKSLHVMFFSQRLYRIITSAVLVSAQESAKEMIGIMRNRDFAKLFQKSTIRKNKLADLAKTKRINRNFLDIVEKAKWMQEMKVNNLFGDDSPTTPMPCITEISLKDLCSNIDFDALKSQNQENDPTSSKEFMESDKDESSCDVYNRWFLPEENTENYKCINNRREADDNGQNEYDKPFLENESVGCNLSLCSTDHQRDYQIESETNRNDDFCSPNKVTAENTTVPNGHICVSLESDLDREFCTLKPPSIREPFIKEDSKSLDSHFLKKTPSLPVKKRQKPKHEKRKSWQDNSFSSDFPAFSYEDLTKDDLLLMWKASDLELSELLESTLREKADLENKIAKLDPSDEKFY